MFKPLIQCILKNLTVPWPLLAIVGHPLQSLSLHDVSLPLLGFTFLPNKFLEVSYEKKVLTFIHVLVNTLLHKRIRCSFIPEMSYIPRDGSAIDKIL